VYPTSASKHRRPIEPAKTATLTLSGHWLAAAFVVELLFTLAL
jgi:hypothetical protein